MSDPTSAQPPTQPPTQPLTHPLTQPPAQLPSLDALAAPPSSIAAPPAPAKGKRPTLTIVLGGIVAVGVLFGGGFALGRATAPEQSPFAGGRPDFAQGGQATDGTDGGFAQIRGGAVFGEVTAVDGTTLTVTAEDGTVTTVTTTDETTVTHNSTGAVGDLAVGDQVTVMGQASESDEAGVTALAITEGESAGFGGFGGGGAGGFPGGMPSGAVPTGGGAGGFPGGAPGGGQGGFPGGGAQGGGAPPAGADQAPAS
jgi:hypothetical protein